MLPWFKGDTARTLTGLLAHSWSAANPCPPYVASLEYAALEAAGQRMTVREWGARWGWGRTRVAAYIRDVCGQIADSRGGQDLDGTSKESRVVTGAEMDSERTDSGQNADSSCARAPLREEEIEQEEDDEEDSQSASPTGSAAAVVSDDLPDLQEAQQAAPQPHQPPTTTALEVTTTSSELERLLGASLAGKLEAAGVSTLRQLVGRTERQLLGPETPGVGKTSVATIKRALEGVGQALRPEPEKPPSRRALAMGDPRAKLVANLWSEAFRECLEDEPPRLHWPTTAELLVMVAETARLPKRPKDTPKEVVTSEERAAVERIRVAFRGYLGDLRAPQNFPHRPTVGDFVFLNRNGTKLEERFTGSARPSSGGTQIDWTRVDGVVAEQRGSAQRGGWR